MCLAGMCQVVVFSSVKVHSLFIKFYFHNIFFIYLPLCFPHTAALKCCVQLEIWFLWFQSFFSFIIFIISFFPIHQYLEVGDHFTSLSQQNANQYENLWAWDHLITSVHFLNVFWNSMYELFFLTATSCTMISLFL